MSLWARLFGKPRDESQDHWTKPLRSRPSLPNFSLRGRTSHSSMNACPATSLPGSRNVSAFATLRKMPAWKRPERMPDFENPPPESFFQPIPSYEPQILKVNISTSPIIPPRKVDEEESEHVDTLRLAKNAKYPENPLQEPEEFSMLNRLGPLRSPFFPKNTYHARRGAIYQEKVVKRPQSTLSDADSSTKTGQTRFQITKSSTHQGGASTIDRQSVSSSALSADSASLPSLSTNLMRYLKDSVIVNISSASASTFDRTSSELDSDHRNSFSGELTQSLSPALIRPKSMRASMYAMEHASQAEDGDEDKFDQTKLFPAAILDKYAGPNSPTDRDVHRTKLTVRNKTPRMLVRGVPPSPISGKRQWPHERLTGGALHVADGQPFHPATAIPSSTPTKSSLAAPRMSVWEYQNIETPRPSPYQRDDTSDSESEKDPATVSKRSLEEKRDNRRKAYDALVGDMETDNVDEGEICVAAHAQRTAEPARVVESRPFSVIDVKRISLDNDMFDFELGSSEELSDCLTGKCMKDRNDPTSPPDILELSEEDEPIQCITSEDISIPTEQTGVEAQRYLNKNSPYAREFRSPSSQYNKRSEGDGQWRGAWKKAVKIIDNALGGAIKDAEPTSPIFDDDDEDTPQLQPIESSLWDPISVIKDFEDNQRAQDAKLATSIELPDSAGSSATWLPMYNRCPLNEDTRNSTTLLYESMANERASFNAARLPKLGFSRYGDDEDEESLRSPASREWANGLSLEQMQQRTGSQRSLISRRTKSGCSSVKTISRVEED